MEVRYENGWAGGAWRFNPVQGFFRASDPASMAPLVDVIEDKDAYHFYFEMPGLKNETIDAHVEDGQLIVAAEHERREWPQGTRIHVAERRYGTIRRAFELPRDASHDKIEATYKDGVLEVTVEKRPESKSAKIQVN